MNNILIIEDDPDIREVIRLLLENDGYTVTEAANGVNGLQLLTEDTDLVILDIMMPGMSLSLIHIFSTGRSPVVRTELFRSPSGAYPGNVSKSMSIGYSPQAMRFSPCKSEAVST